MSTENEGKERPDALSLLKQRHMPKSEEPKEAEEVEEEDAPDSEGEEEEAEENEEIEENEEDGEPVVEDQEGEDGGEVEEGTVVEESTLKGLVDLVSELRDEIAQLKAGDSGSGEEVIEPEVQEEEPVLPEIKSIEFVKSIDEIGAITTNVESFNKFFNDVVQSLREQMLRDTVPIVKNSLVREIDRKNIFNDFMKANPDFDTEEKKQELVMMLRKVETQNSGKPIQWKLNEAARQARLVLEIEKKAEKVNEGVKSTNGQKKRNPPSIPGNSHGKRRASAPGKEGKKNNQSRQQQIMSNIAANHRG